MYSSKNNLLFSSDWLWVCISDLMTRCSCALIPNLTNTSGSIRACMIATATYYLPAAHVWPHSVDADKSWSAQLGQSSTLINIWYGDTERERNKREEGKGWKEIPVVTHTRHERPGGITLATWCCDIKANTSHSHIPLDSFVVPLFPVCHFLVHFFYSPFIEVSAASTCPSSCPWGLIPQHQFVLEEDRGLAFIHPLCNPSQLRLWSPVCVAFNPSATAMQLIHLHGV